MICRNIDTLDSFWKQFDDRPIAKECRLHARGMSLKGRGHGMTQKNKKENIALSYCRAFIHLSNLNCIE